MAKLIGGPLAGRTLEATAARVLVPGYINSGALWVAEDQPPPTWIDAFGDVQFGYKPEYVEYVYERGGDGNYHFKGAK